MNTKTFLRLTLVILMLCIISAKNDVDAGCNGGYLGWLVGCGGAWYVDTMVNTDGIEPITTVTNYTGGCGSPGAVPDEASCSISAGTINVIEWNVSGSLTVGICGEANITVGANVGQSVTRNYSAQAGAVLKDFCRKCWNATWYDRTMTFYVLKCNCTVSTDYAKSGIVEKIGVQRVAGGTDSLDWIPGCVPDCDPPCDPRCGKACNPICPPAI